MSGITTLLEARDSLVKASTPEPWSASRTSNWVARAGGLPDYIQHVSHDIHEKRGVPEAQAIQIAIGVVKNWASGRGKVDATTRAAAAKAVAEWEKMKAASHAKSAAGKVREELSVTARLALAGEVERRLSTVREAVGDDAFRGLVLLERDVPQSKRMELAKRKLAFPDGSYPIENQGDLDNAWSRVGTGNRSRSAVVAHIKRAARKLGLKLPQGLSAQVREAEEFELLLLEADESGPTMLKCPKCDAKQRASNDTCSNCGHSLVAARKAKMAKLNEAASSGSFSPELRRVASAPNEIERHEVVDNGQTVGTIARRRAYSPSDPDRFSVSAVNGSSVGDFNLRSRADALTALRKHLEEAPARVQPYRDGKYLVASPARYNGGTTYSEFPNEPTARHAAGLPAQPSTPERQSKVDAVAEMVTLDLLALGGYAPDRLREWRELMPRVSEGALLVPLEERFNPSELRGFAGKWIRGAGSDVRVADPRPPHHGGTDLHGLPRVREPLRSGARSGGRSRLTDRQLKASVARGPWSRRVDAVTKQLQRGEVADTEHAYRVKLPGGKLGPYTPERAQLHARIVSGLVQHAQPHPDAKEAVFMAGGPASGKSKMIEAGAVRLPKDHVMVNPDQIRALLPEYEALKGRPGVASMTHEEASHISKLLTNVAMGQHMHTVFDTTGNSGVRNGRSRFAEKITRAIGAGYKTRVVYANVAMPVAEQRAHERFLRTGRDVPLGYLRASHADISARFLSHVQHIKGARIEVHDTHGKPKLIAESPVGQAGVTVRDRRRYAIFTGKAREVSQHELASTMAQRPREGARA